MSKVYDALGEETCLACGGDGIVGGSNPDDLAYLCPVCKGNGYVDPDCNMTLDRYDRIQKEARLAANLDL